MSLWGGGPQFNKGEGHAAQRHEAQRHEVRRHEVRTLGCGAQSRGQEVCQQQGVWVQHTRPESSRQYKGTGNHVAGCRAGEHGQGIVPISFGRAHGKFSCVP